MKKINMNDYYRNFLNENCEPVIIFEKYKYPLGDVLLEVDLVLFKVSCIEFFDYLVKDGQVVLINNEFYFK